MTEFRFLLPMTCLFLCLQISASSQAPQQTPRPIDVITEDTHIFLKAEMSPARPDLARRYIQWCHGEIHKPTVHSERSNGQKLDHGSIQDYWRSGVR
ncbi:hypothetical protein ES703_33123 [subsurface metagenome]